MAASPTTSASAPAEVVASVAELVDRARTAQRVADGYDQARVDELVAAAGWAILDPARNRELAELAVEVHRSEDGVDPGFFCGGVGGEVAPVRPLGVGGNAGQ